MEDIYIELPKTINPNLSLPDPALMAIYRDRETRTVWMLGTIDEESYDWVSFILDMNREDKGKPIEERKPIKFIVANYGGSLEEAKMLVEVIKISKTPIWGIAIGMCASAASMIYLACHKHFALPNATFLFHKGSCSNLEGTYDELNTFMENYKKDIGKLITFYKQYTKFSPELIEQKLDGGDWYVYVSEGLENGVVDEVITDIDMFY